MQNDVNLLNRAAIDFGTSEMALKSCKEDDLYLDVAAYHVQQGIEKCLKFQIQLCGQEPPRTHETDRLISKLDLLEESVPEWIIENEKILNSYATKTRYGTEVIGTLRKVNELLEHGREYLSELKNREETNNDYSAAKCLEESQ